MKRRLIQTAAGFALCAGVVLLSACGQSGPLYLPASHAAPAPATSASTIAAPAARTR
ncbi:MAG TPA: lipoprotein [Gammaproteobacteria bacterium]|nr:lipoprotein [Gammaproteobacteria bacterium]